MGGPEATVDNCKVLVVVEDSILAMQLHAGLSLVRPPLKLATHRASFRHRKRMYCFTVLTRYAPHSRGVGQ